MKNIGNKGLFAGLILCLFLIGCKTVDFQYVSSLEEQLFPPETALVSEPVTEAVTIAEEEQEPIQEQRGEEIAEEIPLESMVARVLPQSAPEKIAGRRYAYLTFDDGPSPNTAKILDILSELELKGTFFLIGDHILNNEEMDFEETVAIVQRIFEEGHYIGLHSMSHNARRLYWTAGSHETFYNEMNELQKLIYDITDGFLTSLYRAPYGTHGMFTRDHIRTMAASGLKAWDWHVDTEDWKIETVDAIMNKVRRDLRVYARPPANVVILFHEHDITLEALPKVVEYFMELDYSFLPYHPDHHFQINLLFNPDI